MNCLPYSLLANSPYSFAGLGAQGLGRLGLFEDSPLPLLANSERVGGLHGVTVHTVVCCEIPPSKKVFIGPPSANTLRQCPGETQQSPDSGPATGSLRLTQRASQFPVPWLQRLERALPMYLSELCRMLAFVTVRSYSTQGKQCVHRPGKRAHDPCVRPDGCRHRHRLQHDVRAMVIIPI